MQQLHKYHSIENKNKLINKIRTLLNINTEQWIVLEKIHGSNVSLITDGKEVKIASRTMFLTDEEATKFLK